MNWLMRESKKRMNKQETAVAMGIVLVAAMTLTTAQNVIAADRQSPAKPNIVLFLVDDMGWQDTSVPFHTGMTALNRRHSTPNMERLAKRGMKFTQAYACSVCSPTRVSLMTGLNAARHRVTNWTLKKNASNDRKHTSLEFPKWNVNGLSPEEGIERTIHAKALPAFLHDAGYRTIHVGKAHFGAIGTPGENPLNIGFDVNIGGHAAGGPGSFLGTQNFSANWRKGDKVWNVPDLEKYHGRDIFLTEALTIEANHAMDRAVEDEKPFFIYMSHYAVHVPFAKDHRFYQKYIDAGLNKIEAMYAAMVEGMDKSLGDILANVDRHGLSENTIVLFMSDNGGLSAHGRGGKPNTHNQPLSSGKGSAHEGGVRVPMIVHWPGVTQAGSTCQQPVIIEDFFPTILELAGVDNVHQIGGIIDGQSFVPLLRGEHSESRNDRPLFWHFPNNWGPRGPGIGASSAIRLGDWKLIYYYESQRFELFNIADDIGEQKNLAEKHPDICNRLAGELHDFLLGVQAQFPLDKKSGQPIVIPSNAKKAEDIETDLLIVGGTESGWAAAIQAARLGVGSITIVHDGVWLGGQYTEQALACVDENKGVGKVGWGVDWHPMKRSFHRSGLFKELMDRIEIFNTEKYGSPMPGKPFHGPSTFRPAEAEAIFRQMLQPYIDSGQVKFITNHYPVRADVDRTSQSSKLTGLHFAPLKSNQADLHVRAKLTIDASDWGEAIQVSGAAFEFGPDPKSRYGEPSAPDDLSENPLNEMNPITWAMIVEESDGETPIARPDHFDDRNYPRATHFSLTEFRDLKWDEPQPGLGAIRHWPPAGDASKRQLSVYTVRRIVDGEDSKDGKTSILLNYMNGQDYPLERLPQRVVDALEATEPGASKKNIVVMTREQRQIIFDDAKQHSLGVLFHLQNFVHQRAKDKANSFRNFHLSTEFGTPDNLPPKPYLRESLRLKAMYMMREQDGRNRDGKTKSRAKERFAHVMYPDALFAWQFHYDFHRTGRTYLQDEGASGPWIDFHKPNRHTSFLSDRSVFPLRSLIPERMDGLIGAQGNVGNSSIVSAAIRLHDQRVHIGQAAGATATIALRERINPREIPFNNNYLSATRYALCGEVKDAVPLLIWPFRDLKPGDASFVAVNRLAALRALPLDDREIDFRPDDVAGSEWRKDIVELSKQSKQIAASIQPPRVDEISRGDFCKQWWETIRSLPNREIVRVSPTDADSDGILDVDDPLPFTAGKAIRFELNKPSPNEDGVPPVTLNQSARTFNFCGLDTKSVAGFTNDNGHKFETARGFGWSRDLRSNHRRRNLLDGVERDTFLFTREEDQWECHLENGHYRITVCVGDSGHAQPHQNVTVMGTVVFDDVSTASGHFSEATTDVSITNSRLFVKIGSKTSHSNTCLNWLRIEKLMDLTE